MVDIYKDVYKAARLNSTKIEACGNITVSLLSSHDFLKYDSDKFTLTMTGNKTTTLALYEGMNFLARFMNKSWEVKLKAEYTLC